MKNNTEENFCSEGWKTTKECVAKFVKEVIFPVIDFLEEGLELGDYIKNEDLYVKLLLYLTKASIAVMEHDFNGFNSILQDIIKIMEKAGMTKEQKKTLIEVMRRKVLKWSKENKIVINQKKAKNVIFSIPEYDNLYENIIINKKYEKYDEIKNTENNDLENQLINGVEEFLDFDQEIEKSTEENLSNLNSFNRRKISATEWLKDYSIDQEDIDELDSILNEFYSLEEGTFEQGWEDYIELVLKTIETFRKFFDQSIEFIELAGVLTTLEATIKEKIARETDKKDMMRGLLNSIIEDLSKWEKEVLVEKTAQDIHYLDASIYSIIAQIDYILGNKETQEDKTEGESEELELF